MTRQYQLGDYVRIHDHDGTEITVKITDSGIPSRQGDFMFKAGARIFNNNEILGLGEVPVVSEKKKFNPGDAVFSEKFGHGEVTNRESGENFCEVLFADGLRLRTVTLSHLVESKFPHVALGSDTEVHADLVAESDVINSPAHYTSYPVEVIELTEHMNFCRGNAVKYISRAGLKDPAKEVEDLRKAIWYLEREITRLESK